MFYLNSFSGSARKASVHPHLSPKSVFGFLCAFIVIAGLLFLNPITAIPDFRFTDQVKIGFPNNVLSITNLSPTAQTTTVKYYVTPRTPEFLSMVNDPILNPGADIKAFLPTFPSFNPTPLSTIGWVVTGPDSAGDLVYTYELTYGVVPTTGIKIGLAWVFQGDYRYVFDLYPVDFFFLSPELSPILIHSQHPIFFLPLFTTLPPSISSSISA